MNIIFLSNDDAVTRYFHVLNNSEKDKVASRLRSQTREMTDGDFAQLEARIVGDLGAPASVASLIVEQARYLAANDRKTVAHPVLSKMDLDAMAKGLRRLNAYHRKQLRHTIESLERLEPGQTLSISRMK